MRETRKGAPLQEPITELSEDGKRKAEEKVGKKQKAEEPEEEEEDVSSMQAAVPSELPCRGWGRVRGGEDGQVQALCAREEGQGPGGLRGVGVRSRDVSRCLEVSRGVSAAALPPPCSARPKQRLRRMTTTTTTATSQCGAKFTRSQRQCWQTALTKAPKAKAKAPKKKPVPEDSDDEDSDDEPV